MKRILALILAAAQLEQKKQQYNALETFKLADLEAALANAAPTKFGGFETAETELGSVFATRYYTAMFTARMSGTANENGDVTSLRIVNLGFDPEGLLDPDRVTAALNGAAQTIDDAMSLIVILQANALLEAAYGELPEDDYMDLVNSFREGEREFSFVYQDWTVQVSVDIAADQVTVEANCAQSDALDPAILAAQQAAAEELLAIPADADRYALLEDYVMQAGSYEEDEDRWCIEKMLAGNIWAYLFVKDGEFSYWEWTYWENTDSNFTISHDYALSGEQAGTFKTHVSNFELAYGVAVGGWYGEVSGTCDPITGEILTVSEEKYREVDESKIHEQAATSQQNCYEFVSDIITAADIDADYEMLFG